MSEERQDLPPELEGVPEDVAEAGARVEAALVGAPMPPRPGVVRRLAFLFLAIVTLFVIAYALGLTEYLDADRIRGLVESAGPWGFVIFVALFVAGTTAHVPSWVFIGVATLLWGALLGGLVCYVSALITITIGFFVVRQVGGEALAAVERPWMKRVLARLEERPVVTVILLRVTPLFLTPAVSYALALTPLRYRDFLLGSAIGVVPGIVLIATGANAIFAW
jgi:uncharacterized membrane protein YdjX (TVP38/TMEM64 family)